MLELDWVNLHTEGRRAAAHRLRAWRAVGRRGLTNDSGQSAGQAQHVDREPLARRGEWNVYDVVAVDGVVKLSVNGKFVNGLSRRAEEGYLCLESEGAEIHFRNIRILELPPG